MGTCELGLAQQELGVLGIAICHHMLKCLLCCRLQVMDFRQKQSLGFHEKLRLRMHYEYEERLDGAKQQLNKWVGEHYDRGVPASMDPPALPQNMADLELMELHIFFAGETYVKDVSKI